MVSFKHWETMLSTAELVERHQMALQALLNVRAGKPDSEKAVQLQRYMENVWVEELTRISGELCRRGERVAPFQMLECGERSAINEVIEEIFRGMK